MDFTPSACVMREGALYIVIIIKKFTNNSKERKMTLFKPTYFTAKVLDIDINFLKSNNFEAIILDIDDTLVPHKHPTPDKEIIEWIETLKNGGIKIIIVSNNFKKRVSDFAKILNIPYIYMSLKPLTYGFKKAIKTLSVPPEKVLVIGDQIFTDIVGANFLNIRSVLVEPVSPSKTTLLKIKRKCEKPLRKKIKLSTDLKINL